MDKKQSKYFYTANCMDEALLQLLSKKEYPYITIKEICNTALVNRSTFYLHYESMDELLAETIEKINAEFLSVFDEKLKEIPSRIQQVDDINKLNFITPEYLNPYLNFIKKNKILFSAGLNTPVLEKTVINIENLKDSIIEPILKKTGLSKQEQEYTFYFYCDGLLSIIKRWIQNDCKDDINFIIDVILKCFDKR